MDAESSPRMAIAFSGPLRLAAGPLPDVAAAVAEHAASGPDVPVLVFDSVTSEPIELDLRGAVEEVRARSIAPMARAPRPVGRPKLGVVAREVTLLPRHWDWLAAQPGSASVTLRKLVEKARLEGGGDDRIRRARDSAYRFMLAVAGDEAGYEEANRALYAGDRERFDAMTESWPPDVRDHARDLAEGAFAS